MSHKVMLLSAVLRLAKKEKISGEVESTLLYYVSYFIIIDTPLVAHTLTLTHNNITFQNKTLTHIYQLHPE